MKRGKMTGGWIRQEPFENLPDSVKRRMMQAAQPHRLPAGAVLFQEGDPADSLWILEEGWAQLVKRRLDGKSLTLDLVTPKDRFFGISAFSGDTYLATAVAVTPIMALRIPGVILRQLLRSYPSFGVCVVKIFSARFHHMAAAYSAAFAPVEQRITSVLLRLDEDFGATLPVTRRQIAELAGTTVETAIRVTNRMRRENLVLMHRGQIVLVNPQGLYRKLGKKKEEQPICA
jgi:CRP/FNR family transcriptional regulator